MANFDEKKDYYKVLGVESDATVEDIKTTYIQLALLHHPDTADKRNVMDGSEFVSISEAWSVLSKPELRKQYDDTRRKYLVPSNVNGGTSVSSFPYSYEISENYQVQKMNYGNVKHRASSNWKDLRDKYQTDKWKELPLSKKKLHRSMPLNGYGFSKFFIMIGIGCVGFSYYVSKDRKQYS